MSFDQKNSFETEPQIATGLASPEDVKEIVRLQQENLEPHVSTEEKATQGYVSLETPAELLEKIVGDEGIIVAKSADQLVGYLIPMTLDKAKGLPFFAPLIGQLDKLQLDGKPLDTYNLCVLAQICINKQFRGGEAVMQIHRATNNHLKDQYDLGVTEISDINKRSLRANIDKIGMIDVGQFEANGITWHVVVTDFRKLREAEE